MNDLKSLKAEAVEIGNKLGFGTIRPDWSGIDTIRPMLEKMADEGAIVVLKIDGLRSQGTGDSGRYTVVVSGGHLGDDYFHSDTNTLEEGLCRALIYYSNACWT